MHFRCAAEFRDSIARLTTDSRCEMLQPNDLLHSLEGTLALHWDVSGLVAIDCARVLVAGSYRWMLTSCLIESDRYQLGS